MTGNKTFQRRHRAKLASRLGPSPAVAQAWFLPWSLYHFVGTPGGYTRPAKPAHLTMAENPGVFDEWARFTTWRQRKQAGVAKPALGLWRYGRLPVWAITVSKEMDRVGKKPPLPQPPTPQPEPFPNKILVQRAQRVMFTAWRPLDARGKRVSVTADLNVAGNPGQHVEWCKQAVQQNLAAGLEPSVWGNQSQVGIEHMYQFAAQLGVPYIIWQAESVGEMVDFGITENGAIRPGSPMGNGVCVLIGNANAWTPEQRDSATRLIHNGRLSFIQETYTNSGDPWPENYGTQGVPASSIAPGVGWDRYPHQLPEYKVHTPASQWPTISLYIAETFDDSSWAVMPW